MHPDNNQHKIEFEGEEFQHSTRSFQDENSKMPQWIINHSGGKIKNENTANFVLILFAILIIIISLFLFFSGGKTTGSPEDIIISPAVI